MPDTSPRCNSLTAIVAANRFSEVCYVSFNRIFRWDGQPAQPLYASRHPAAVRRFSRPEAPAYRHAVWDGDHVYPGRQPDRRRQRLGGQRYDCRTLDCAGVVEPRRAGLDLPALCAAHCRARITSRQCDQYPEQPHPGHRLGSARRAGGRAAVVAVRRAGAGGHSQPESRRP
ncbi:hypothetical protein D3C76_1218530 [compost metagenome]